MLFKGNDLKINLLIDSPKRKSFVWKYFGELINISEEEEEHLIPTRVFCSICLKIESISESLINLNNFIKTSSYLKSNQSTDSLFNHLSIHKIYQNLSDEDNEKRIQYLLNNYNKDGINQEEFNFKFTMMLINTNTSEDFSSNFFVQNLFNQILPSDIKLPSRKVVSIKSKAIYNLIYTSIRSFFVKNQIDFASICLDICYNKIKRESFIGINLHFVINGELNNTFLRLEALLGHQDADDISLIIKSVITEFNLVETKLLFVTDEGNKF